jgi:uncharacterized protein YegP (UPF0339 family)
MSEVLLNVDALRIEVYQDNYGDWRWVALEAGEAVERSDGYFDSQAEALASAQEVSERAQINVDGVSQDLDKLPPPPKINTLLEAQRGGYAAPEQTPAQLAAAEAMGAKLRNMQAEADARAAEMVEGEKAATAAATVDGPINPSEGMGLDGGPTEATAKPRARARGKKDAAPVEAPSDPLAKQVASRQDPDAA